MKFKLTILLLTVVVTMGLLLGASAAQAANVRYDPTNSKKVIEIRNLEIGDKLYNVTFPEQTTALELYGEFPGVYPFGEGEGNVPRDATMEAVDAVNAVLNAEDPIPFYVGVEGGGNDEFNQVFIVGYGSTEIKGVQTVDAEGSQRIIDPHTWAWPSLGDIL